MGFSWRGGGESIYNVFICFGGEDEEEEEEIVSLSYLKEV